MFLPSLVILLHLISTFWNDQQTHWCRVSTEHFSYHLISPIVGVTAKFITQSQSCAAEQPLAPGS